MISYHVICIHLKKMNLLRLIQLFLLVQLYHTYSFSQYNEKQQSIFEQTLAKPVEGRSAAKHYLSSLDEKEDIGLTENIIGLSFAILNNADSALFYFNSAIENLSENHEMLPRIYANKAILYRNNNNLKTALRNLFEAENIAKEQGNKNALAIIYGEYSSVYTLLSRNQEAIEMTIKAISILEEENSDKKTIAIEKQKLGNLYRKNSDFDFARQIYDEVLPILKGKGQNYTYLITLINYADIIQHFEGSKASSNFLLNNLSIIKESQNNLLIKLTYSKLGNHLRKIESKKAYEFLERATDKAFKSVSTYTLSIVSEYLKVLLDVGNQKRFEEIIVQMDLIIKKNNFPLYDQINYFNLKSSYFAIQNDFEKAYQSLMKYKDLSEQKAKLYNSILALEIKEKYKNELLYNENLLLNQKAELVSRKNLTINIVLVAVLFITTLLVYLTFQKRKNIEKQNIIIQEKLNAEQKLHQFQIDTINSQKKELLRIFDSNLILKDRLTEVKNTLLTEKQENEALKQLTKLELSEDKWEDLVRKLRVVEKDFFNRLVYEYPTLTKREIDFCALVRIGLEYKQIANVLSITYNSVITKKYRLSKKLQLNEGEAFQNWIMSI